MDRLEPMAAGDWTFCRVTSDRELRRTGVHSEGD